MKKIIFTLIFMGAATCGFAQYKIPGGYIAPQVVTESDSVSFYIGVDMGRSLVGMNFDIDIDNFVHGLMLSLSGKEVDTDSVHDYLRHYFTVRLPERQLAVVNEWLDNLMSTNPRLVRTESGLIYEIISQGDMAFRAQRGDDTVEVSYTGCNIEGVEFDSNDSAQFELNRVIPGWAEGLKLIGKGGRIKLYVHPDLGYGQRPQGPLPANSIMVFDVTLLDAPEVL